MYKILLIGVLLWAGFELELYNDCDGYQCGQASNLIMKGK